LISARHRWSLPRSAVVILILIASTAATPIARAQDRAGRNEFGIWGAYSTNSLSIGGSLGHGQLGFVALRYTRRLSSSSRPYALFYTIDIEPAVIIRQTKYVSCVTEGSGGTELAFCPQGKEWVYAGGADPIGLKLNLYPQRRWQPFIALSCGQVTSLRPVPIDKPGGTQFNFTAGGQLGLERFNSARTRAWRFGYKFQHISNGGRGPNPGLNLNELFLGYSFFK
jgi:Lipid A 3-O-deacylase (PagL)